MFYRIKQSIIFLCVVTILLQGCGSGGEDVDPSLVFIGSLRTREGAPVADAEVTIFETADTAVTDEDGSFYLESSRRRGSLRLFFRTTRFTNTIRVEPIPPTALVAEVALLLDPETNNVELVAVEFDSDSMEPPLPDEPSPSPEQPDGEAPLPTPTATPVPSQFDEQGNTTSFGIPSGIRGNINRGRTLWDASCASCHAREKSNRNFGAIKRAFRTVPAMSSLDMTDRQIADLTAYLNRNRRSP